MRGRRLRVDRDFFVALVIATLDTGSSPRKEVMINIPSIIKACQAHLILLLVTFTAPSSRKQN